MRSLIAVVILVVAASSLFASSTLYVGFGASSPCAMPQPTCLIDPNLNVNGTGQFTLSSAFSVYNTSSSQQSAVNSPLLLIMGVAGSTNPTLFSQNSITGVSTYSPYTGTNSTPTTTNNTWSAPTYAGYFSASSPQKDVYAFLGLGSNINNSQNITNWNGALNNLGVASPTGYGIYVFQLNAPVTPQGLVNIQFASNMTVPHQTYILAYGTTGSGRNTGFNATPFTKTALQYPEPGSWLLLSTAGLATLLLRRMRKA